MFKLRVEPDGAEPYEVEAKGRDVVRWESIGRDRYIGVLETRASLTALAELAWCASVRLGLYQGSMKEFLASADVAGLEKEETDPDEEGSGGLGPTRTAP